jgi:prepilin-type N-terminal cleavage/methylation domain-containing protein
MKTTQRGFTLVEIAIVLVIIGLLLGGVLKGQEMIIQAKIKNAISDYSGVSAAYHGYLDRYRATPGDDGGATRWTAPTAAVPGNNNRVLQGTYNAAPASPETAETRLWWDHLRRSGFIAGQGADQPMNAFNGILGVQAGDGAGGAALTDFTSLIMCSSNMPDKVAIAVDVQMDDGNLITGALRGQLHASADNKPAIAATVAAGTNYVESGTNIYTLCRQF